ncbi:MAG: hypothetical protein VXY14_03265 [Candidatus Thermoplasmatota archaeon]|nr:hypothetical protein [Candidatus Thermoplasmatota archaeon]
MAGRSGDFRKDDPKRSEPLDASTNNPFKVHIEAHKAKVQREAKEHREVLQSLWDAAQTDLSNRAARIEDVFVQALHSVTDLINHAIASEDPITNPHSDCEVQVLTGDVIQEDGLEGMSLLASMNRQGLIQLTAPGNGRVFRSMTAESAGLIQPRTATLHTEAYSIDLISGRSNHVLRRLPDGVLNFPVAIDENGGLVRVSQCGDLSRILSDFNLQRGMIYSRHVTPKGWGVLTNWRSHGKTPVILFNHNHDTAHLDAVYSGRPSVALMSPASEVMVVYQDGRLDKVSDFDKPGERVEPISVEAQDTPIDVSPDGRFLLTISKIGAHLRSMEDLSLVWTITNGKLPFFGGLFLDDGGVVALDVGNSGGSIRTGLFDTVQGFEIGHDVRFDPKTANQRGRTQGIGIGRVFQQIPLTGNVVVAAALDEAMNLLKSANFEATWTSPERGTFEVKVNWAW